MPGVAKRRAHIARLDVSSLYSGHLRESKGRAPRRPRAVRERLTATRRHRCCAPERAFCDGLIEAGLLRAMAQISTGEIASMRIATRGLTRSRNCELRGGVGAARRRVAAPHRVAQCNM